MGEEGELFNLSGEVYLGLGGWFEPGLNSGTG